MGDERVKLHVSVPASVRKAAKVAAAREGVTLEALVERALRAALERGVRGGPGVSPAEKEKEP